MLINFNDLLFLQKKVNGIIHIGAHNLEELPDYLKGNVRRIIWIEANPEKFMWGTDWPHPNKYEVNPNDGDLVDAFGEWVTDDNMRQKIMVTNPEKFYSF